MLLDYVNLSANCSFEPVSTSYSPPYEMTRPRYSPTQATHQYQEIMELQIPFAGCHVCGDKVNGSRYGAPACLGCIVFFRRAITKAHSYKCTKNGTCYIDHESRCICRYCRLKKCFTVGMNPNAIQRRDVMGPRLKKTLKEEIKQEAPCTPPHTYSPTTTESTAGTDQSPIFSCSSMVHSPYPSSTIYPLLHEILRLQSYHWKRHRSLFAMEEVSAIEPDQLFDHLNKSLYGDNFRRARGKDVNSMLKIGLLDSIEWANQFRSFRSLDQISKRRVLSEYGFYFMMIDQGYYTAQVNKEEHWILQNDNYMFPDYFMGLPEEDAKKKDAEIKAKFHPDFIQNSLRHVGVPMIQNNVDHVDVSVLKCMLLLKLLELEYTRDNQRKEREGLRKCGDNCLVMLNAHTREIKAEEPEIRLGNLIMLMSGVRESVLYLINQMRVSDTFNFMKFDDILRETYLC